MIEALQTNISVTSGHKAVLICSFTSSKHDLSLSSSHQLIWIRQSYGSHSADSILAHNQDLLISDSRLSIQRTDTDYTLTITNVNIDDEGIYACEVNTQPPQNALIHLFVQGKQSMKYENDNRARMNLYKSGTFICSSKCTNIVSTCFQSVSE
jgi:hypothetical protein